MRQNTFKTNIVFIIVGTVLFCGNFAQAALSTYVEYYPCSGGSDCQLTETPLTAISTTNAPVSVGDSNGSANGQSDHGVLIGSASGTWLGGEIPSLTSYGFANPNFEDTITLSGGTGNVAVTATLHLDGAISTTILGVGSIQSIVAFNVNDVFQYAQLLLSQSPGDGVVSLIDNTTATWLSPNGTFTQGDSGSIFPVSPNGTLTLTVNLPYDTPVLMKAELGVEGLDSVASNAHATLTLSLPEGTTLTSTSGTNYGAATTPPPTNATVSMLPETAFWVLFAALAWISIMKSSYKTRH
jgi:hypothetical protein